MQINTALNKATTKRDRELHHRVRLLAIHARNYLGTLPEAEHLSFECHSIAWALSLVIPELKLVHGIFYGIEWRIKREQRVCRLRECNHSWLVTPNGAILDPYPVGFVTVDVVMVVTKGMYKMFGGSLYRPDDSIRRDLPMKEISQKAHRLARLIRQVEKSNKPKVGK